MMDKSNWKFFKDHSLIWLYKPMLPKIKVIDSREEDDELRNYDRAWGFYKAETNQIIIIKTYDCLALRIHEYGHWFTERLRRFLDAVWEFPWWGLGVRSLFNKELKP